MQVDHIIPVHKAQISKFQRMMIRIFTQNEGVNSMKNLTSSCAHCNKHKSSKTGIWVIRGYAGRYKASQIFTSVVRYSLFLGVICFAAYSLENYFIKFI